MRVIDTIGRESIIFELEKVDYDRQFKFRNIREIVEQNWDVSKISIDKNTEIKHIKIIFFYLAKQVQERPMLFYICC